MNSPGASPYLSAFVGTRGLSLYLLTTPHFGLNRSLIQLVNDLVPVVANSAPTGDVVFPYLSGVMQPPQSTVIANSFTVAPTVFDSGASSIYHSLQARIRMNPRKGLLFNSAFTYSHSIDDSSDFFDTAGEFALPQDSAHPSERGSSGFDERLRSVTYFVWNLPGKRAWSSGWRVSGIFTAQTGQPYTVNTAYDVNHDGNLTDRHHTTR